MLNGQFAFAIFDRVKRLIFLARDHFGIAPVFYSEVGDVFLFSSEIKAILEYPGVERRANLQALDQVFAYPGLISPATMFDGIYSLKPGHFLTRSAAGCKVTEYWDLEY